MEADYLWSYNVGGRVHACQIIHFSILRQSARGYYRQIMPVGLADQFRRNADECRQQAEKSWNILDKALAQDRRALDEDGTGRGQESRQGPMTPSTPRRNDT